LIVRLPV